MSLLKISPKKFEKFMILSPWTVTFQPPPFRQTFRIAAKWQVRATVPREKITSFCANLTSARCKSCETALGVPPKNPLQTRSDFQCFLMENMEITIGFQL